MKGVWAAITREPEEEKILWVEPPGVAILRQQLTIKYPLSVVPLWN